MIFTYHSINNDLNSLVKVKNSVSFASLIKDAHTPIVIIYYLGPHSLFNMMTPGHFVFILFWVLKVTLP